MNSFTLANNLLDNPEALREQAQRDGYLFFHGLADTDLMLSLRRQILALCERAGWLEAGTDPMEGIAAPGQRHLEPEPGYMQMYKQVMQLEDFHAFAHQPRLLAMLDALFGETTLVHARNIARIIFPQATQFTTPAHQDFLHIQGTEQTWTSWIPLGDCPQPLGSLAVLPGSHKAGMYPVHRTLGAGGHGIDTNELPFEWVGGDFAAGDVLLFHSLTVHKGMPNQSANRLRLSVDFRYQPLSHPITPASMQPHYGYAWEEIYRNWQSPQHQYYWRDLPLHHAEFTTRYYEAAREADRQETEKQASDKGQA